MGRPSDYTPELAARICAEMSEGKSIRTICAADDMPAASSIYLWLNKHPEFSEQYARAGEDRAHALAEEALEIADDTASDYTETDDGPKLNPEHVQRSRLRVDTRKWFASKLAPKKFGDRMALAGEKENPVSLDIVGMKELLAEKLARLSES